jgi:ubiquinone/menaquinone biosynthesis C-methylase UbiE
MKLDFDKHRDVWGPLFTWHLQSWGKNVFEPALILIKNGQLNLPSDGLKPTGLVVQTNSKKISKNGIQFHLLQEPTEEKDIIYFDMAADEYEMAVKSFKSAIVYRTFQILDALIPSNAKILDCACGSGYETIALAQIALNGEVIGIDLSKEMIKQAYRNAKNNELSNGFYQCDAAKIQYQWDSHFDIIFCQLSCSYFKDIKSVIKEHERLLHSEGIVVLIEPLPNKYNALGMDLNKAANPLFQRFYDVETLQEWYKEAGFKSFYWEEILPGIAMYIFTK